MTDYARADRHRRYRLVAQWASFLCVLALVPEVFEAIKYHFPAWDDIAMPITMAGQAISRFVIRKTAMYDVDL